MASEPKKKHSKGRKRTRRASIILESANLVKCKSCGELTIAHQVCKSCGFYLGKQVIQKTKAKVTRA